MLADFAVKWFALYYFLSGLITLGAGLTLFSKYRAAAYYLKDKAGQEEPPALLRTILKYIFLFTLPGLILSFFPFSWPELLFSVWSLFIVYIAGSQLLRWPHYRQALRKEHVNLQRIIRKTGVIMMAVSPVMFLFGYLVISRLLA